MFKEEKGFLGCLGTYIVGVVLINIGLIAFGIWVVIKVMQHFGVIGDAPVPTP